MMLFSTCALELGPNEFVVLEESARFHFPDQAPVPFSGKDVACRIRVTSQNLELEGTLKKLFRPDETLWALLGLDQIKKNGSDPLANRKGRVVTLQCIGENEPVELTFSSEEHAVRFTRAIWDQLTGTTEIQRHLSSAGKMAASLITGFAGAAGEWMSQASKAMEENRRTSASSSSHRGSSSGFQRPQETVSPSSGGPQPSAQQKTAGSGMTQSQEQLYAQIRQLREAGLLSEEEYESKCRILFSDPHS